MSERLWLETGAEFLGYVDEWLVRRPRASLSQVLSDPLSCAVVSVDMTNGFCHQGSLASPRAHAVIPPVVDLLTRAWEVGVPHFLLSQDTHDREALEFAQFPPHAIRGTTEAETIPEIRALPFYDRMRIFEKNSISCNLRTGLDGWVDAHPEVLTYIVVGVCTDLCTSHLALYLLLDANARQTRRRVIVPADCVDTYDLAIQTARAAGAPAHPADFFHRVFLYGMALQGVEIVASLE
jgi:nicotinamidase-related amidase